MRSLLRSPMRHRRRLGALALLAVVPAVALMYWNAREERRLISAVALVVAVAASLVGGALAADLVRRATRREREAAEALRDLDDVRHLFVSAVSHDLRNPIAAVRGFADTLHEHLGEFPPDRARHILSRIGASARAMDRLLGDLLDMDRLSRGDVRPQRLPTRIRPLVDRVADDLGITSHPLEADVEDLEADVDPVMLDRIVGNLVANAQRRTRAGTPIWVRAHAEREGLLLVVDDAGDGVPDELKETTFEPRARGAASGAGVGLYLVARFAEILDGRAWVEDRPGGGASFRVFLPCAVRQPAPSTD